MPLYLDSFHPVHMHIIKTLHSLFVIGLLTTIFPSQATAANNATNNQTKIDLVKKVYLSKVDLGSEHNRVTTPELQKIIRQFNKFDTNIRKQPDMEMGCDMPIHYYFDLQGFMEVIRMILTKALQVKVTSPHTVRATFKQFDGHRVGADFTLKCTENRCLIDDFKMIGDQTGIKTDYKLVLRKQKCE